MVLDFKYYTCTFIILISTFYISCDNGSSFPTLPDLPTPPTPTNPTPPDGSVDQPTTLNLTWELPGGEAYYAFDLYFGVEDDPPLVAEEITGAEYAVTGLGINKTYYWRVAARDMTGQVTLGPVWSFTTYDGLILWESFEGDFPPENWELVGEWVQAGNPYSGLYCAENNIGPFMNTELYSPWVSNTFDGKAVEIGLYYRLSYTISASFRFFLENDNGSSHLFTVPNRTGWTSYQVEIPYEDLGDEFRVIFYHQTWNGSSTAAIDDFSIRETDPLAAID
ncbi:MAG: hypothetical protein GY771_05580 [bacterium]|nr:hypothetical protein [bacterium]